MRTEYKWTDGSNKDFIRFYSKTEEYYSNLVGGLQNRQGFVPYNYSDSVTDVLIAYIDGVPVGCAGLRRHSNSDAELKRVWVEPEYRSQHIATDLIGQIEEKARKQGFKRIVLQTREKMRNAVKLYRKRGYKQIENYPPYDKLDGAVCYSKEL